MIRCSVVCRPSHLRPPQLCVRSTPEAASRVPVLSLSAIYHPSARTFAFALQSCRARNRFCPRLALTLSRSIYHRTVQSSGGDLAAYLVVAAAFISTTWLIHYDWQVDSTDHENREAELRTAEEQRAMMAGTALPGRPGNLTEDQGKKLQELWTSLFQILGVPELATVGNNGVAPAQADQASHSETPDSGKKHKSRLNLFGRKQHDPSDVGDANSGSTGDGEDKYGQAKDFDKIIQSQSKEDLRAALWAMVKHDNPDALLLRFLRARKWNVRNALIMLVATVHWRHQDMHLDDDIIRQGEAGALADSKSDDPKIKAAGEDFLKQIRMGKSFLRGSDIEGRPICLVRVKLHRQHDQGEASLERYTVYTIETARLLLSSDVDTAAVVFDMTDFSLSNMDYGPVKFMIKVFEANYPESLGVVLVHKSPWVFNSIWKLIRGWLDPVVASKIHFTQSLKDFEQYVPKYHIPKELGGDDLWDYQYTEPQPGENKLMDDTETRQRLLDERSSLIREYERITQQWIQNPGQASVIQRRKALVEDLRSGYWRLDPYIRARTFYDRMGMIDGEKLQIQGSQQEVTADNGIPSAIHSVHDVD